MDESTPFDRFQKEPTPSSSSPMSPAGGFGAPTTNSPPAFDTGGGWGEQSSGWFRENASSVILPLVALAVLGGGVYFYTRGTRTPERPIVEFQETMEGTTSPAAEETQETQGQQVAQSSPAQGQIKLSPEGQPILGGPEPGPTGEALRMEGGVIHVKAQLGEGITHLARRASREYLSRSNPGFTVTNEHKIYIEDFLKDAALTERTETSRLALGEEISFSETMLKQAVENSRNLTDTQLKNLEQFSAIVTNL